MRWRASFAMSASACSAAERSYGAEEEGLEEEVASAASCSGVGAVEVGVERYWLWVRPEESSVAER